MAGVATFIRRYWIPLGIAATGAALLVLHALVLRRIFLGNSVDDAYISYRYADHLVRGLGLVFNRGEHVEGYSNFLWVILLALLQSVGADPVRASQGLGVSCSVASLGLAVMATWKHLEVRSAGVVAFVAALLAGSGYVAAWAVGGLEGPLFGLLLVAAWWASAGESAMSLRRQILAASLFALLALTRPEGGIVALGAVGMHVGRAHRRGESWRAPSFWMFPALVLGVLTAYHAWRFVYYGPHLFPNSVRAKLGGGVSSPWRGVRYVARQFLFPYLPLLLPPVLLGTWKRLAPAAAAALRAGNPLFLGLLLLVAGVGGDWGQGRFFAPLLPLAAALFAIWLGNGMARWGSTRWGATLWGRGTWRRAALWVLAAAYLAGSTLVTSVRREAAVRRSYAAVDAERIMLGKWLAENIPADVVIAVHSAGQIPYYSRLPAHDMLGLNDEHIAGLHVPLFGRGYPGHEKFDPAYTLETIRPGIIIDGRLIPGLERHVLYRNEYYPLVHTWKLHEVAIRRDLAQRLGKLRNSAPP